METQPFWKSKLTPYDAELFMMVESLTGKPCEPKNGGDSYFFEADYEKHNQPEYILAIWDAIEGRTGKRLISIKDDAERHSLLVRVKFSDTQYPGIIRLPRDKEQTPTAGRVYCRKLAEIRAIQVDRNNADALLQFVGNGELEIPEIGPAIFHFRNAAGSVYAHAPELSYIVYVAPERFEIVDEETFEREYERK